MPFFQDTNEFLYKIGTDTFFFLKKKEVFASSYKLSQLVTLE